jgi:phosphoserine phosphatase RsbU/P
MAALLRRSIRNFGYVEKLFLVTLTLCVAVKYLWHPGALFDVLLIAALVSGTLALVRLALRLSRRLIWGLRNRLIVAYLFIAVVPVVLTMVLGVVGINLFTGQFATYLITSELNRRAAALSYSAQRLASPGTERQQNRAPWLADRFPGLEIAVSADDWHYPDDASLTLPPKGWGNIGGLMLKDGRPYLWAHAVRNGNEAVMAAPVTRDTLSELVPGLGEVYFGRRPSLDNQLASSRPTNPAPPADASSTSNRDWLPPQANRFDIAVTNGTPVQVALWDYPGTTEVHGLVVRTRLSAVLRTVFSQEVEYRGVTMSFYASVFFFGSAIIFLIVEVASLLIGIRLTRTITQAVHNLYEGTLHVREGDFSHRIEVVMRDQLGELTESFNRMTENLERLVQVAKEKERLQSELEIASEVQSQLYPRFLPVSKTLQLTACCHPARVVSGDYYDYLNLQESELAIAIGDVAGKGISAALLMATLQASMRTQLGAGREIAATVSGSEYAMESLSTASLVSRLNHQLYAFTSPEKFATFYFAVYDEESGLLRYTNAGHLPPLLLRNGSVTRLEVTGTVVGAFPFSSYEESQIQLQRGDLLVCYTDGVTEPENEYGEMFGEERMIQAIYKSADHPPEQIVTAVMDSVRQWTGSPELQDDMTMLLARRI